MGEAAAPDPNQALLGQPDGLDRLDTPALVLDLDALEANLAAMAAFAAARGVGLRPHAKTHKSVEIGRRQLAAGAVGLCCAKLGEAEVLAAAGLGPLLVTGAVIGEAKVARLAALNRRTDGLAVVIDDPGNAAAIAAAGEASGKPIDALVVCDVGGHRFGVRDPAEAVALARAIAARPGGLRFRGIQGYHGPVQHLRAYAERREASLAAMRRLGAARDALRDAGLPPGIVTGGGTGTHDIDPDAGVLTDLQVGSYVFNDVDYGACALTADGSRRFAHALFVLTRVVSNKHPGFVTTDAGSKCFATDGPAPEVARGAPPGSTYRMFGDQFGRVDLPPGAPALPLGAAVLCVVPHCDPTVNLYDRYHCVRGGALADLWPVDARGRVT